MKKIIILIGIISIIIGLYLLLFLTSLNFDEFIDYTLAVIHLPETKKDKLIPYFSSLPFLAIQLTPLVISLLGVLTVFFSSSITSLIIKTKNWSVSIKSFFTNLPKSYKYSLGFIITGSLIFNLYNTLDMPISYDEAWTYLNFTKHSIFSSISYYPAPNNHILHSIFTGLTVNLPFSQTTNLRLPNLVVSLIASLCFFYIFTKLINKKIALILLPLYCFFYPTIYYSYLSRGYILILLSFMICFYSTLRLVEANNKKQNDTKYHLYLAVGSIIGFYTMPSFLYPYFTCVSFIVLSFIVKKEYTKFSQLTLNCAITTSIVIALYSPTFIISGIDAVIHNKFVDPISRSVVLQKLIPHFNSTSIFLFEVPIVFIFLFLMISSILLLQKKIYSIIFALYLFLIAPLIVLIHSIIAFPRTWIYLIIPFLYIIGLLLKSFLGNKRVVNWSLIISVIVISSILILNFNKKVTMHESFSVASREVANYLISNNANNVYCNHPLIETNLVYLFEENNRSIDITYSRNQIDTTEIRIIKSSCDYLITTHELNSEYGFNLIKMFDEDIYLSKVYTFSQ